MKKKEATVKKKEATVKDGGRDETRPTEAHRRPARCTGLTWDDEHGCVGLVLECPGFTQAFGLMCMDPDRTARFVRSCARTLGAPEPGPVALEAAQGSHAARDELDRLLRGLECACLWTLGEHNEPMEGIEAPDGTQRLTVTGFRRGLGLHDPGGPARARAALESTLAWAERRVAEARGDLQALSGRTFDWGDGTPG